MGMETLHHPPPLPLTSVEWAWENVWRSNQIIDKISNSKSRQRIQMIWQPPPKNWYKLNFDGSKKEEGENFEGIIHNLMGIGMGGYAKKCGNVSSNKSKFLCLQWGVELAKSMGI